jgi:hypothetical protein
MLFIQFDWLLIPDILALFTSRQNADEHIFLLNDATVSPNMTKTTKFCLTVCRGILYKLLLIKNY